MRTLSCTGNHDDCCGTGLPCELRCCRSGGELVLHLAEQRLEMISATRREADDARTALAPRPFHREDALEQRGTERTRQMIAPHAPVEAGLAHRPPRAADCLEVN